MLNAVPLINKLKAMKNLKTILLVIAATNVLQAQDTIYTKSGTVIPSKVYEVTQNEVRYQKSSNLEGPIYTIDKNNVSLIEYKNGTKDIFSGDQSQVNQSQPNQNSNTYNKDGSYYGDDVYNQGQSIPATTYNSSGGYYNPGVSMNFMFGMPSLFWGVPYYAGPWGGWPYYRSYYRPYWAYNYYHPWGGRYGGYGAYGWRNGYHGGYGWRNHSNIGHIGGGYHGGSYNGPRGGNGGYHGGGNGGFHGGGGGFHGGGGHGGGGGGGHSGGGGHHR
jgi:hypothetical protein